MPSSSILSQDPTVLFTTAGMQQFKDYYLGKTFPYGKRAVSAQKCFRTSDIEEVGDGQHLTFLEMLGNFSFSDYFKEGAIEFAYELLTTSYQLPAANLWITVFKGGGEIPEDKESREIWQRLGIPKERIFGFGKEDNFWGPTGEEGPCGPTTEIHYELRNKPCALGKSCIPNCGCGRFVELWNIVFNEYYHDKEKNLTPLKEKGVDTGMGLERLAMVIQKKPSVFETDLFQPLITEIQNTKYKIRDTKLRERSERIIADHIKGSVFLASEGVMPSNIEEGYVLRRVLRRAMRFGKLLTQPSGTLKAGFLVPSAKIAIEIYKDVYPELQSKQAGILTIIQNEEEKFEKTLDKGLKKSKKVIDRKVPISPEKYTKIMQTVDKKEIFREIYRAKKNKKPSDAFLKFGVKITQEEIDKATISGKEAFDLYQTYGFPVETIIELAQAKYLFVDIENLREEMEKHQEVSRAGAEKKFGGVGISKHEVRITKSEEEIKEITRLHTATHLLHSALREVLGKHVKQMGSDITSERLRFDFSHPQKMTDEEIRKVEDLVNQKIKEDLDVKKTEIPYSEAIQSGALAFFKEKYPEIVKVYSIDGFSREICGGPHVEKTSELGRFKIKKEESCGAGTRRIKAILE